MAVTTGVTWAATCALAPHHGAVGYSVRIQISDDLAGAVDWHMVVLVEVNQLGFQPRTVLHRLGDSGRKHAGVHGATGGAAFDLGLMLGDFQPYRWNVEDLPPLVAGTGDCGERRLTLGADCDTVQLHMIRLRHGASGVTWVPNLSAGLLATGRPQATGFQLFETVTGGRFATVTTVLG